MMVCTFGDGEDVKKWKEDELDTRIAIDRHGKMTSLAQNTPARNRSKPALTSSKT